MALAGQVRDHQVADDGSRSSANSGSAARGWRIGSIFSSCRRNIHAEAVGLSTWTARRTVLHGPARSSTRARSGRRGAVWSAWRLCRACWDSHRDAYRRESTDWDVCSTSSVHERSRNCQPLMPGSVRCGTMQPGRVCHTGRRPSNASLAARRRYQRLATGPSPYCGRASRLDDKNAPSTAGLLQKPAFVLVISRGSAGSSSAEMP